MTAALFTLLAIGAVAVCSGLFARWTLKRWPPATTPPDPLDPEGNQAAVSAAVSVAARTIDWRPLLAAAEQYEQQERELLERWAAE